MSSNTVEHDYATYIISQALQDGNTGQVVYVEELKQESSEDLGDAEEILHEEGYQLVAESGNDSLLLQPRPSNFVNPRYKREAAEGNSGFWSEADVHRLLKIYLKHLKEQPTMSGKPTNQMWQLIVKEFDLQKKFSRVQVKTKIQRLKKMGRTLKKKGGETEWQFWKPVSEILDMEKIELPEPQTANPVNKEWTETEIQKLLKEYRKQIGNFASAASPADRKVIWLKIANAIQRPRYQVTLKFQALKAKWRRWKRSLKNSPDTPISPVINAFNKLMTVERIARQQSKKLVETSTTLDLQAEQEPWSSHHTSTALDLYKKYLKEMKDNGQVLQRQYLYKMIAKEMGQSLARVKTKLTGLRTHYKNYRFSDKKSGRKWQYYNSMQEVTKLENAIWNQLDEDNEEFYGQESNNDSLMKEPTWFKNYRAEVEQRHKDRVNVLQQLLNVLEGLAEKVELRT